MGVSLDAGSNRVLSPWAWLLMLPLLAVSMVSPNLLADDKKPVETKPLDAVTARGKVGEKVEVLVVIQAAKDRLEKRGEIYLDTELDFRDPKNLAIVITREGARSFQERGIRDIVSHFQDKQVIVKGTVTVKDETPRIEVDDAANLRLFENK